MSGRPGFASGPEAETTELGEGRRIGEGGDERAVFDGERGEAVFERDGGGDAVERLARSFEIGEIDEVESLALGGGAVGEFLGDEFEVD